MRKFIWELAVRKHPKGRLLIKPLLVLRSILFPLQSFYWQMHKTRGYQWESDTWEIEGIRYTGAALRALAESQGETYKITRTGGCVNVERVDA